MSSGNIVVHIRYDTLLLSKVPEQNRCMAVAVNQTPQFFIWVLSFFIGFEFLFFILADLLLLCLKSLSISRPSLNSIQVES
jgi:hypothetical protein